MLTLTGKSCLVPILQTWPRWIRTKEQRRELLPGLWQQHRTLRKSSHLSDTAMRMRTIQYIPARTWNTSPILRVHRSASPQNFRMTPMMLSCSLNQQCQVLVVLNKYVQEVLWRRYTYGTEERYDPRCGEAKTQSCSQELRRRLGVGRRIKAQRDRDYGPIARYQAVDVACTFCAIACSILNPRQGSNQLSKSYVRPRILPVVVHHQRNTIS